MQNRNISTAFLKGLEVLAAFSDGTRSLTLAEVAQRTGHDRATARRLCLTLVEGGFLARQNRDFRLTPRVMALAGGYLTAQNFGLGVHPALNAHAVQIGGEVSLAVLDGESALFLAHSAPAQPRVSIGLTVGSRLPLLPTAIGRMILAQLPEPERATIVNALPLARHTDATCQDRARILTGIARAAESASVMVMGEYETGICGIAVPVAIGRDQPGAIGTTLPIATPDLADRCRAIIPDLQNAAQEIARATADP